MDPAPTAVTSHLAALLPAVGQEAAASARLMHDRRLAPLWLALAGSQDFVLAPTPGPGAGRLYDLMLESDAGVVALAIASTDDTLLAMASATGIGARLRSLVVDALLDEPIARLAELALPGARVVALSPVTSPALARDGWCALRRDGVELCRLAVQSLGPKVADALLAAQTAVAPATAWRAGMRLPTSVVLAERRVRVALLESLEPGDVLLLPGTATTLEGATAALRVRGTSGSSLGAAARVSGDTITLLEGLHTMDNDTLPDAAAGTADALGQLELPLRFEIETVSIPLAELEAIEPGYVIEFGTPVSQARLRLVSCGLVVGEADLIAVGNRLGARITHLAPRDE